MQSLNVPDLSNQFSSTSPIPRGAASEEFSEREFLNVAELDQVHLQNSDRFVTL